MTDARLSEQELVALIQRVFRPRAEDRKIAILVDLPDQDTPDDPDWLWRRELAASWARALGAARAQLGLETDLLLYRNVRMNNADLPSTAWLHEDEGLPATADELEGRPLTTFESIFTSHSIALAPTRFSATAPLKLAARKFGFRAATLPGFTQAMIPALRLDYGEVNRRVLLLTGLLDRSERAEIEFQVDGLRKLELTLDLRHRKGHASGGLLPEPGTAGNLPSGESYIVPYEGERDGDPSRSEGLMPVQFGDEIVVYRIVENLAIAVESDGPESERERELLAAEPAYGNLAELGLGVLADFGVEPIGEVLLDEKLGLHIAFGRSDHFGGQVGAAQFSAPEAVVHIDRVYLPAIQPRVRVLTADLHLDNAEVLPLIRDDRYVIVWG